MNKTLLKTLVLTLLYAVGGSNAWAQTNILEQTGVSVSCALYSGGDIVDVTTNDDKSITYSNDNEVLLTITLSSGLNIDASKAYIVMEASNAFATTRKVQKLNLDNTEYTTATHNCSAKEISSGKHALLWSPLGSVTDLFAKYITVGDDNMSLKELKFILKPSTIAASYTINRIGIYDIAEIESIYSNTPLQFVSGSTDYLRLEFNGSTNQIKVKNNGTLTMTADEAGVMFKSMGALTTTMTTIDLRGLVISSGNPLTTNCMSNLATFSGNASAKINLNKDVYKYFPNTYQKVYLVPSSGESAYKFRHRAFVDGSHPNSGGKTLDAGSGGTTLWYCSYVRQFKKGYNSVLLPYEVSYNDLTATGLTAYTYTSIDDGTVTFTKLASGTIAEHTPFIVKAESTGYYLIPSNGSIDNSSWGTLETWYKNNNYATAGGVDCYLIGSFINEVPGTTTSKGWPDGMTSSNYNFYGIKSDGSSVAKMNTTTKTTYYRAFLAVSKTVTAPMLSFDDISGTTDIISIEDVHGVDNIIDNDAIYNLQGVRMNAGNLPKGIYVKNGKKFVIK